MAKKQPAKKPVKKTPVTPPKDIGSAVVGSCLAECTEQHAYDYACMTMAPPEVRAKFSDKQKHDGTIAMCHFAALGFAFYQWCREKPE